MTRVATPQNEDYLLLIAGHGTASHVERLVRIADHYLTSDESAVNGGDRCTLHIHTDMNTLQADGDGAESELAEGGETRLDNLLFLCRHHHRLVHEGGYGLAMPVGGEPVFTAPNGRLIPGGPDTRFRGNVFALTTGNRRERVEIGARTGVPYWCGERMDDGMAVEGLVRRE